MGDDLVAIEVEVDPGVASCGLPGSPAVAVEAARLGEVVDGEGKVEERRGLHDDP